MPTPHRSSLTRRHSALRRRGTWAAVVLAVAFGGVLIGLMIRGWANVPEETPPPSAVVEPPQAGPSVRPVGPQPDLAGAMESARLDLLDRSDRTRKIGELVLERTEPSQDRHYRVTRPRASFFLEDGRTVHIQAEQGHLYIPEASGQPESGRISGDVLVRLFDAREDGSRIDPEVDVPSGALRTNSLYFDRTLGELSTSDEVLISSALLDAGMHGLMAIVNESRQRLERLETVSDGWARYRPQQLSQQAERAAPPASRPTPAPGTAAKTAAAPRPIAVPVELLYSMTLRDDVVLMQGGRRIATDVMDVWLRLIDGALPPNAIADVTVAKRTPAAPGEPDATQAPPASRAGGESARAPLPAGDLRHAAARPDAMVRPEIDPAAEEDAIDVTWSGPALIVLAAPTPPPLVQDHVALRLTGEGDGLVAFEDDAAGVRGLMPQLDYLATTRRLSFTGPAAESVRVVLEGRAAITAGRIESDLGTGLVDVPGPISIVPDEEQADRPFRITASERSSFVLAMREGALTGELEQAMFAGNARLESNDGVATAGFARSEFRTLGGRANNLVRLVLEENAEIRSARDERTTGNRIDIAFEAVPGTDGGTGRPQPDRATITGGATASQGMQQIESEFLEAQFTSVDGRSSQLESAVARGSVRFSDPADGLEATADELRYATEVNGRAVQEVDLTGQVLIVRSVAEAISRIRGTRVRLDGEARTLEVLSRGSFHHQEDGAERLVANWTRSMWFDDAMGVIRCEGDAEAISTPDPLTRERVAGQRLALQLTPGGGDESGAGNRELASAEVIGADREGERALFESRRFAADPGTPEGRRLEQLVYLEGARIDADNLGGTLDVPSAGRLLLVDHRADEGSSEPTPPPEGERTPGSGMGRGSSLFAWRQSLAFDRTTGLMNMIGGVEGTHRRLEDGDITAITCDRLTARTTPAPPGTGLAGGEGLTLLSAHAVGSVHLSTGPERPPGEPLTALQELTADIVEYDAQRGIVEASATEGNIVTLINPGLAVPTTARALWWDMVRGTIRITQPAPVVTPR
jgi:hypothetical protein